LLHALIQFEEERSDEQLGATSSAPGTTTLVSKGTVPKIFALALENGALTQSRSGTTVTFRGNLGGSVRALAGKGLFQLAPENDPALGLLTRASFSASFDTSRGTENAANTFTGDQQQLSQWTFRLQLVNHRDPQSVQALTKWKEQVTPSQIALARAVEGLIDPIFEDAAVKTWLANTDAAVQAAKGAALKAGKDTTATTIQVDAVLRASEEGFPTPGALAKAALESYDRAAAAFVTERHKVIEAIKAGALATVEYTSDRPLKAPRTSNLRLVGTMGGSVDLTGNASVTLFEGAIPLGASGRVRDVQLSGGIDIKMGSADTVGAFIVSLSGKYVRQLENGYTEAGTMMPDTKGTIAVGQLKITIPVSKGSGVKMPLSITVANRTDLVKEAVVRANVGVSYDLDSVFAKFRP
jgi:hypothetical protein